MSFECLKIIVIKCFYVKTLILQVKINLRYLKLVKRLSKQKK